MLPRTMTLLLLLPLLRPAAALAQQDAADDFKPLFNGRDLAGWTPVNVAPDTFTVKDGVIACTGRPTGVLRSERMYENFVVELEWRHLTPGGNAGFFVWSDALTAPGVPFTRAIEVQVLDGPTPPDRRHTTQGDVFPIHGATMIPDNPFKTARPGASGRSYPTEDRTKPSPEWNHYRIECNDGKISLAVNGKVVTTGHDASPRKGYLCLESEGGQVEWRNLKIKELPPTKDLDPRHIAQKDEGFRSLYTGVDLSGWEIPKSPRAPGLPHKWHAKDWILHFDPSTDIDPPTTNALITTASYANFDFIFDLRTAAETTTVNVRGTPVHIDKPADPKAWRRVQISARANQITLTVDGRSLPADRPDPDSPAAPIILFPRGGWGPTDFANLYVRDRPVKTAR